MLSLDKDHIEEINKKIKHIEEELDHSDEEAKVELYYQLADAYLDIENLEKAEIYALKLMEKEDPVWQARANHLMGLVSFNEGELNEAIDYFYTAIQLNESAQNFSEIGKSYNMTGSVYFTLNQHKEAFENMEKSIEWNTRSANHNQLGKTFYNLRLFLTQAMNVNNRRIFYENHLEDALEKEENALAAFLYHNLGLWYQEENQTDTAREHFEKSLEIKSKHQITFEIGTDYYYLGSLYDKKGDHQKAIEFHLLALKEMLKHKQYDSIGIVLYYLEHFIQDCQSENLVFEAQSLMEEARTRGFSTAEIYEEAEPEAGEVKDEELITDEAFAKNADEVAELTESKDTDELDEMYQQLKAQWPSKGETLLETAEVLLGKMHNTYKNAWFSKKNKKTAFETKKADILNDLENELTKSELDEKLRELLGNTKEKIENLS